MDHFNQMASMTTAAWEKAYANLGNNYFDVGSYLAIKTNLGETGIVGVKTQPNKKLLLLEGV